jgi:hypothetical protein
MPTPAPSPVRGWPPLLLLPPAVFAAALVWQWPAWVTMWAVAAIIFAGCKWLTWRRTPVPAPTWVHLGYLYGWPGLDVPAFFRPTGNPYRPTGGEWLFASAKTTFGIAVVWFVSPLVPWPLLRGWVGMVGLVFVLHFGSFHLLSCLWRTLGRDARPLMNWPVLARSLSDFWGRRWNTAFRDLTHRFLFAPLARRIGPQWAVAVGFLFSGIVHDVVISVPAGGGHGWPTLYFGVQGGGLLLERKIGASRLLTAVVLLAPAFGLFHPPFVLNVVVPFLDAICTSEPPASADRVWGNPAG